MIDLVSAGERALDTLDSITDLQIALKSTALPADLSGFLHNMKLSEKSIQYIDSYFRSKQCVHELPLRVMAPVIDKQHIRFNVSGGDPKHQTMSSPVFKTQDTRLFQSKMMHSFAIPDRINRRSNFL
jgi:hypothetical protein